MTERNGYRPVIVWDAEAKLYRFMTPEEYHRPKSAPEDQAVVHSNNYPLLSAKEEIKIREIYEQMPKSCVIDDLLLALDELEAATNRANTYWEQLETLKETPPPAVGTFLAGVTTGVILFGLWLFFIYALK